MAVMVCSVRFSESERILASVLLDLGAGVKNAEQIAGAV